MALIVKVFRMFVQAATGTVAMTDTSENITFPQLCWRTVKRSKESKQSQ